MNNKTEQQRKYWVPEGFTDDRIYAIASNVVAYSKEQDCSITESIADAMEFQWSQELYNAVMDICDG